MSSDNTTVTDDGGEDPSDRALTDTTRRTFMRAAAAAGTVGGLTGTASAQEEAFVPEGEAVRLETVAEGLSQPVGVTSAGDGSNRLFIVDQPGQLRVHDEEDGLQDEPFLDIGDQLPELGLEDLGGFDERGFLGVEFHPDFENNRRFYVRHSAPSSAEGVDHRELLVEYRATSDLSSADPDSREVLMDIDHPQFNHNAGSIEFGPDDYLYIPMGDGGAADDNAPGHVSDWYDRNAGGNAQNVEANLLGTILRIDVDSSEGDKPYGIPENNPLVEEDGLDEIYAWGLRNPWRISFDDEGRLFAGDLGQNLWEEVDIIENGGNYGWNVREGTHCFSTDTPNEPPSNCPSETPDGEPLIDPIVEYPHQHDGETVGISITGGYFYEGPIEEIRGKYVFGDWSKSFTEPQGRLFAASPPDGGGMWEMEALNPVGEDGTELGAFLTAFGMGRGGELYICTSQNNTPHGENGAVHRFQRFPYLSDRYRDSNMSNRMLRVFNNTVRQLQNVLGTG
jgi:glucose/arabinose dehydrogenase